MMTTQDDPLARMLSAPIRLKKVARQGWLDSGIAEDQCESVADHSFGVALMCMLIGDRHQPRLDMSRVLRIALLHDLPEVITGDLTPSQVGGDARQKAQREMNALRDLLGDHPNFPEYAALLDDYIRGGTDEARFVKQVDKLERLYQASDYEHTTQTVLESFFKHGPALITSGHLRTLVDQLLAERQHKLDRAPQLI